MLETECNICCENFSVQATYSCTHKICYKCATRLVYLYKDKKCPICKSEKNIPFFESIENVSTIDSEGLKEDETSQKTEIILPENLLESLKNVKIHEKPLKNNLDCFFKFQNEKIQELVKDLLLIKCKECAQQFRSKKDLLIHFKKEHSALLCSTCVEHNHQFWYEYSSYTLETLGQHRKGKLNEPGFDGHVFCPFCNYWLYSKERAKKHCMQEHQICTVCDVLGLKLQFFKNFTDLEQHYRSRHFCCNDPICKRNHCYVYGYKSELCAHSIAHHGVEMLLSDVQSNNEPNPQVFSLYHKDENSEHVSLYSTGVNILNPLIKTPFFPSFSDSSNSPQSPESQTAVPSFLNRQILHDFQDAAKHRETVIKSITVNFSKEIASSIEKFISGTKVLSDMVAEIEESVGSDTCLKILQRVSFSNKQKEVSSFTQEYKKQLKFPVFKKSERPIETPSTGKKEQQVFRIIDFSKNKK